MLGTHGIRQHCILCLKRALSASAQDWVLAECGKMVPKLPYTSKDAPLGGKRQNLIVLYLLCMQAVVVPSLEETPEQGAEEAIVEHKVNYEYLLSMPISSLTLEKVGRDNTLKARSPRNIRIPYSAGSCMLSESCAGTLKSQCMRNASVRWGALQTSVHACSP